MRVMTKQVKLLLPEVMCCQNSYVTQEDIKNNYLCVCVAVHDFVKWDLMKQCVKYSLAGHLHVAKYILPQTCANK